MKSPIEFIVEIKNKRQDRINLKNGGVIYLSPVAYDGYDIQTRVGKVISTPESFDVVVNKGDTIFFHHNITKETQFYGNKIYSDFKIKDGLYRIPATEIYGYIRDGDFNAIDPYVFVEPITKEEVVSNGIILEQEEEDPSEGIVKHSNKQLREQGVKEGDRVLFTKYSKYQLGVNDNKERLFRMKSDWIAAKINE